MGKLNKVIDSGNAGGHVSSEFPCGDDSVDTKSIYIEILRFKHFMRHMVFTENGKKSRNKEIKNYINVSVAVEVVCGNTKKLN